MKLTSFESIINETSIPDLIKDHSKYLAHTPDELLSEHMDLVSRYFILLVDSHGLEPLLDAAFLKVSQNSLLIATLIKKLFWETILFHDLGKINENFQRKKMENYKLFSEDVSNGIDTQHSILSAYIFLAKQFSNPTFNKLNPNDWWIFQLIAGLAHNIVRHHSSSLDNLSEKKTFSKLSKETCEKLSQYVKTCNFNHDIQEQILQKVHELSNKLDYQNFPFDFFAIIRLNFSLLTASDYYATSHFYGKWKTTYNDFGILNLEQKARHYQALYTSQAHNKHLYENYEKLLKIDARELMDKSNDNLNRLRSKMAAEVLMNTRKYADKKLFYIEAPTGGGKTNMAFIAASELLKANPELSKVFYVFPFTTLITQTQQAAVNSLCLDYNEFIELHSKAEFKEKQVSEAKADGLYGEDRLDDIHNLFVNYPYVFLSHIRFFDILKANNKTSIYLLHRLANSVVVIDEVQAYNPQLWDKTAYLLKEYSELLNIRFVVMSATLPKIGELDDAEFTYLLPDSISRFFTNPNFADRVTFSDCLVNERLPEQDERESYLNQLMQCIYEKTEEYRAGTGKVRAIVEFIFKKSASEFAKLADQLFTDYEILVLTGTILDPIRKETIAYLKNPESLEKNILLVTTQVVEAGVDIDMDLGFKNKSIIDSEEQLAGRVNRNVKKENCKVYLFELDDASVIYRKDLRYKELKKNFESEYLEILKSKRFDKVYEQIKRFLDQTNKEKNLGGNLPNYKGKIGSLDFPGVDKDFRLIDNENINVFVPLKLNLFTNNENGEEIKILSDFQIKFLTENNIAIYNDHLDGSEIFSLYKAILLDRSNDFAKRKKNVKILQSIMSLFTFSLFSDSNLVKELIEGGNPVEYGYLYLTRHEEIYDLNIGLIDSKLSNLIFL